MRVVAAIPSLALIAGCAIGVLVPVVPNGVARAVMVAAAIGALVAVRSGRQSWLISCVVIGFAAGGALLAADAWQRARYSSLRVAFDELARAQRAEAEAAHRFVPEDPSAFAFIEGELRSDASPGASGVALSVAIDRIRGPGAADPGRAGPISNVGPGNPVGDVGSGVSVNGGALLTVVGSLAPAQMGQWRAGRRVLLPVELRRPGRFLDDGVPDAERALQMRGTSLVGTVKSGALVDVLGRGSWIEEKSADIRASARRAISDAVGRWSTRSAAIVTAIVIGDRAGLDEEVQRRLQEAGTYHVIAISGGNIAILAGLMIAGFRLAGLLGRTAMIASIVVLTAYGYLVGGGASVDRATLMAVVYFAARAADQRSPPLNALACVAGCLIAAQPLSVVDPAFVLTFGATFAILTVGQAAALHRVPRLLVPLAALFAASAATEALLFPVGALLFSRVTFAGLALNFLAIPLMAVAQVAGMAVVPAAFLSRWLAMACGFVAHLGAAGLVQSADLVRFAPMVTFRVAPPSWPVVAIYYAAVVMWWRSGSRVAVGAAAAAAVWMLAEPWALVAARGDGRLHITFLDVGQGDSALVRFPRGATLLVDAGGAAGTPGPSSPGAGSPGVSRFDIGDRVVAPPLRLAGVRRLDYLVLTHGDPDHIGGAAAIVREFEPREIWEGIPVPRFEPLTVLRAGAQALGLRWTNVSAGDRIVVDGVEVAVHHPPPADWERQRVRNDDSVVVEVRWRDLSVLLTGDIGKAVERALPARVQPSPLRVVKVPHHGSLTSSTIEFVRALAPRLAVVSAGRANHFGHPAPDVLERYREAGAEIFRTDRDGAVTVDSDGYSFDVHTFTGRRLHLNRQP